MRAQLDCRDPRLPGSGVFDIKTRAVAPIRLDVHNYKVSHDAGVEAPFRNFDNRCRNTLITRFTLFMVHGIVSRRNITISSAQPF